MTEMNEWIQSGVVKEIQASQNIAFILEDNSLFSLTGYKVLKSQGKNGLLDCTKVKYNGKIKLIYFTSQYKSLKNMIPVLSVKTFLTVIANLFSTII